MTRLDDADRDVGRVVAQIAFVRFCCCCDTTVYNSGLYEGVWVKLIARVAITTILKDF